MVDTARKLRLKAVEQEKPQEPALYVVDPAVVKKVAELGEVNERVKQAKAALKADEKRLKSLKEELEQYAREENVKFLESGETTVEFTPRVSRAVEAKTLFMFLRKLERLADFWKYVKVNITDLTKDYGEAVLEREGVIVSDSDDFGTMTIRSK